MMAAVALGAWKSALLLLAATMVSAPIRWNLPTVLRIEGIDKGALCLMLALLGLVTAGVELSSSRKADPAHRDDDHQSSARPDSKSARADTDPASGRQGSGAPADTTAAQREAAKAQAIHNARSCDAAHKNAAGAIDRISQSRAAPATRSAVEAAVSTCEASWISFNRPEMRVDPDSTSDDKESEGIRACDQGYMGRWLANDDLLSALDAGLPAQEVGRIERMNSANDQSVTACADLLRQFEAKKN